MIMQQFFVRPFMWGILFLFVLGLCATGLSASPLTCPQGTTKLLSIQGSWYIPSSSEAPNGCASNPVVCPSGVNNCGYFYIGSTTPPPYSLGGPISRTGAVQGWHGYQESIADQAGYLNGLSYCSSGCTPNPGNGYLSGNRGAFTFALNRGAALHNGDGTQSGNPWRNPTNDAGYFLSTPDSQGFTITFGSPSINGCNGCITHLAFYWGSADPYNEITFLDSGNHVTTFRGSDFPLIGFDSLDADTDSVVIEFAMQSGGLPWQSVTFSSPCNGTEGVGIGCIGQDRPAFEIDDLQWTYGASGPTPEPSCLLLLGSGVAGLGGLLRRRLHS